ncbi:MAG: ABC transporter ATP-binding protein/permease [Oscillospiraceae bacterium]|jgi:ATP-binding cassette subfamily B protein|nr:ABC transporter ATP-binding protein/permease [Oscillospiraceae bacterium]
MNDATQKSNKFRTIVWGFRIAWSIDPLTMLLWFAVCGALAVLPAVALYFNKQTLSVISGFLSGQPFTYSDAVRPIIGLGLLMIAIGLSGRINSQFVRMMTYDLYFAGMGDYIMEHVQDIEMKDLLRKDVNDMWMSAILEANSLWAFNEGICFIFAKLVGIAALLVTAFTMSTLIFAISLVYVVVIFVISLVFAKKTRYNQTDDFADERKIEYYEKMLDNHGMAKETRIFENTDDVITQWRKPYQRILNRDLRRQKSAELRDLIVGAGFYVFLIVTVGVSLYGVARGMMPPDVFLVLFTLCLNLYNTINGTARYIVRFDFGLIALDKQRRFFELIKPGVGGTEETLADEDTVFDVQNLTFSYSDTPTIKDISFSVNKGEIIALVGANGSGKSTLVKLLLNMYKPDSGSVKVFGREYRDYKRGYIRTKIGVFFQNYYIFHSPLRENIGVGAVEDMDNEVKILEALKKGGAEKLAANLPNGIDTLLGKFQDPSGTELSGGEKQRVASSRAHMSNRDVLIFDEPASMLDPIAEMEQFNNIRDMLNGRTAILISHRVGFARMADKIIMLDDGRIAETGKHDELMTKDGLYAHFFNEQAQWYQQKGGEE